ncbi:hypothetical protein E2C01_010863 [Portunus trituberculatus]|uniref:Uncharacterized protein n=1 Tax=Portunus trituberculatus TaxID=210409 RepID=A0A5B7D9R1_PORTR|nr:hypothetical protein [Portunus trituberculatus]
MCHSTEGVNPNLSLPSPIQALTHTLVCVCVCVCESHQTACCPTL